MNIGQIKLWAWAAAALLTLGLTWYVANFITHLDEMNKPVDQQRVRDVLGAVEPVKIKNDRSMTYDQAKRVINLVDWTGAPTVVAAPVATNVQPTEKPKVPVKRLLRITFLRFDTSDPQGSRVSVRYKPESGVTNPVVAPFGLYKVGDKLAAPLDTITVQKIEIDGVTFAFSEAGRDPEKLSCEEFDTKSSIVIVGPDGVIQEPPARGKIPRKEGEVFVPGRSTAMGPNTWVLGTEDVKEFDTRWQEILGNEIKTQQHRDPKTGRYDGIEIKSVLPGSIGARHGAQEGDIIKSINGTPVNSTNEAIQFVKTNKDNYSKWEVVVENRGKQRTVTYQSPGN